MYVADTGTLCGRHGNAVHNRYGRLCVCQTRWLYVAGMVPLCVTSSAGNCCVVQRSHSIHMQLYAAHNAQQQDMDLSHACNTMST